MVDVTDEIENKNIENNITDNTKNTTKIRAFIALDLPIEFKKQIYNKISKILTPKKDKLKLVESEQLHLTLFFFPSISTEKIKNLSSFIDDIKLNAFKIKIKGVNTFNLNKPSVIFIDLIDESNSITYLYNKLKDSAFENGASRDHEDFVPHITIARIKKSASFNDYKVISEIIRKNQNSYFGDIICNEIKIFKSDLTPNGPIYTTLYKKVLN